MVENRVATEDDCSKLSFDVLKKWPIYHTRQRVSRTIGAPALQGDASSNSGVFETTPLVRYLSGECGSTVARSRLVSSRVFPHQLWPYAMKNRCSGVNPSSGSSF